MVTGVLGRGYAQENGRNPELSARWEHCVRARRVVDRGPDPVRPDNAAPDLWKP